MACCRPVDAHEEGKRWSDVDRADAVDDAAASAVPASSAASDTRPGGEERAVHVHVARDLDEVGR